MLSTPVTTTIVTVPRATASWIIPDWKTSPDARTSALRWTGVTRRLNHAPVELGALDERIEIRTLSDGGQQPAEIAHAVAAFLDGAQHTLDVSQYDFNLGEETGAIVGDAFRRAHARGVQTRFTYNVDHGMPVPVPPPPEPDVRLIASLPVDAKAIAGIPDLMHHKYVVRDGADVWTGSLNWTDDSWSRQENVVAIVHSEAIAKAYRIDFDQLWSTGDVEKSGFVDPRWEDGVRAWFTPGHGEDLSARIAKVIRRARRRVRICSPVITTGPVLGTLAQVIADRTVDVAGCVDATQIREVVHQWRANDNISWKLPLLLQVMAGQFAGKESTPYGDGTVHDFMHAKVCICDDTVFVGSFNLSRSGEKNAENVLEIEDAAIADRLAAFVDGVRAKYPPVTIPAGG
jgi:phosphatidylserine/phosphatidylglycerophosphate/cardiolipin synthase-like enzyme